MTTYTVIFILFDFIFLAIEQVLFKITTKVLGNKLKKNRY